MQQTFGKSSASRSLQFAAIAAMWTAGAVTLAAGQVSTSSLPRLTIPTAKSGLREYDFSKIRIFKAGRPSVAVPIPDGFKISFEFAERASTVLLTPSGAELVSSPLMAIAVDSNAFYAFHVGSVDTQSDLSKQLSRAVAIRGSDGWIRHPMNSQWAPGGVLLVEGEDFVRQLVRGTPTEVVFVRFGTPIGGSLWVRNLEEEWVRYDLTRTGVWVRFGVVGVLHDKSLEHSDGYVEYLCAKGKLTVWLRDGRVTDCRFKRGQTGSGLDGGLETGSGTNKVDNQRGSVGDQRDFPK